MSSTDKKLDLLLVAMQKMLDNPVAPIAPIAPVAPVLPIVQTNSGDHDMLVAFRAETVAELKNIRTDIATLNDGTSKRIDDHEIRIKSNETKITQLWSYGTVLIFLIGIVEFFISKVLK